MHFYSILLMMRSLFLQPAGLMQELRSEDYNHRQVFWNYGLVLIAIASLSRALISFRFVHEGSSRPADWASLVVMAFLFAIMYLITIELGASLISRLAPHFKASVTKLSLRSVIVLAYTPIWLAQLVMVIHHKLSFLGVIAVFYTAVLLGIGIREAGQTTSEKVVGFTLASMFILLGISYVATSLLTGLRIL